MAYFHNVLIVSVWSNFVLGGFSAEFPQNDEKMSEVFGAGNSKVRERPDRLEEIFQNFGLSVFQVIGFVLGILVAELIVVLIFKRLRRAKEAETMRVEEGGESDYKYLSHRNMQLPKVLV